MSKFKGFEVNLFKCLIELDGPSRREHRSSPAAMAASERRRLVAAAEAQEVQLRVVHPERDSEDQLVRVLLGIVCLRVTGSL